MFCKKELILFTLSYQIKSFKILTEKVIGPPIIPLTIWLTKDSNTQVFSKQISTFNLTLIFNYNNLNLYYISTN